MFQKKISLFFFVLTFLFSTLATATSINSAGSQWQINDTDVIVWANEAAVVAYTYNFKTYRKQFQGMSKYFTQKAWTDFQQAFKKSGNLDAVIKKKFVVSAVATGSPLILSKGIKDQKFWIVELPLLVTYVSESERNDQNIVVRMRIVEHSHGYRGLAIEQFSVVMPKNETTKWKNS